MDNSSYIIEPVLAEKDLKPPNWYDLKKSDITLFCGSLGQCTKKKDQLDSVDNKRALQNKLIN